MLVTLCICLKQYFDTRYLVFYNTSPPRMFLSLDLLWEYWIQHGANGPLYVTSCYSTWIFCRGVSGFATDCPCDVWCRGLTTCLLHVGPPFGNRILNNSFRLCNWLSLRRLVSWINHLPPACWSTFRKSNSKQQLGCRFDIMDYESYFFVFWHMQLYMS